MPARKIIEIDEEKCDGCGLCVPSCAEGALAIIDGKARLVSDVYCDGLGACLGECPNDALRITEREAPEFDEEAAMSHAAHHEKSTPEPAPLACGCPGSLVTELKPVQDKPSPAASAGSAMRNWPIQLHLVPTRAPFFKDAELLIAADCTGFSLTNLHGRFLPGKSLIIACPKLDDVGPYEEKLAEIFKVNSIKSLTVLYMTVPCCTGLVYLVRQALKKSGKSIPLRLVKIDPAGEVVEEYKDQAA